MVLASHRIQHSRWLLGFGLGPVGGTFYSYMAVGILGDGADSRRD